MFFEGGGGEREKYREENELKTDAKKWYGRSTLIAEWPKSCLLASVKLSSLLFPQRSSRGSLCTCTIEYVL